MEIPANFTKYDLALFQRSMNRCYNIRLKFLNINVWYNIKASIRSNFPMKSQEYVDNLRTYLTKFLEKEDKTGDSDTYTLLKPIDLKSFIEERKDGFSTIDFFICPQLKEGEKDNRDINSLIYHIFPDSYDPIFYELRTHFPIIKLYVRYYYLALIFYLEEKEKGKSRTETKNKKNQDEDVKNLLIAQNPIGYYELIQNDNRCIATDGKGFYTVFSCIRLTEKVKHYTEFEKTIKDVIKELNKTKSEALDYDSLQYILTQMAAYPFMGIPDILQIAKGYKRTMSVAFTVIGSNKENKFKLLSTYHKMKVFDCLPFLVSLKTKKIIQGYAIEALRNPINDVSRLFLLLLSLDSKETIFRSRTILEFNICIILSDIGDEKMAINLNLKEKKKYSLSTIDKLKIFKDFDISILHNSEITQEKKVSITTNLNEYNTSGIEKNINYYLNKSYRDNLAKKNAFGRIFLNILRFELEKIDIADLAEQYNKITKFALQKVMADEVYYISFNDYKKEYKVESFYFNRQNDISEETQKERSSHLEKSLNEILNSDDTSSFKTKIEQNVIISRFVSNDEIIFADRIDNNFMNIIPDDLLDKDIYKDCILSPLVTYNRKLGILILLSYHNYHFNMSDRILLTDFLHNVGIELFESKIFTVIQRINKNSDNIYDSIADNLLDLLNAKGIAILLKNPTEASYNILSQLGNVYNNKLEKDFSVSCDDMIEIAELDNDKVIPFKTEMYSGISIPLKHDGKIFCHIIVFDEVDLTFSESLRRECLLLGGEIAHIIWKANSDNRKREVMQSVIAHDVSSQLRSIDGVRKNIQSQINWMKNQLEKSLKLSNSAQIDCVKKIDDSLNEISIYCDVSKQLIDYFIEDIVQGKISGGFDPNQGLKKLTDSFIKNMTENDIVDVNNIINEYLSTKKKELDKKEINPIISIFSKKFWIHNSLLRQIIDNMITNIIKYANPKTACKITLSESYTGWNLVMENKSKALTDEQERKIHYIFKDGVRYWDETDKSVPGLGKGLYSSRCILLAHGGDISVKYTKIDANTASFEFTLYFPFQLNEQKNPFKI